MTAVYDTLSRRWKKRILTLISITTALFLAFLAYESVLYVLEIKGLNRLSPALQFPVYIIYAVIPIGLFIASLQYLIAFIMNITHAGVRHTYVITDAIRDESVLRFSVEYMSTSPAIAGEDAAARAEREK